MRILGDIIDYNYDFILTIYNDNTCTMWCEPIHISSSDPMLLSGDWIINS